MRPERLADDVADGHARIQRRERVLEDDLQIALQRRAASAARERRDVAAEHGDRSGASPARASRSRARASTCPLPDSPTTPSVSPGASVRSTPSTASQQLAACRPARPRNGEVHAQPSRTSTSGAVASAAAAAPARRRAVEPRHRREQRARVLVLRPIENVVDRSLLLELAAVHHEHAVREARDDAEIVRDEDDRGVEAPLLSVRFKSSRICACTVTSSAVVGSSAIEHLAARAASSSRSSRAGACRPRARADSA